jgi:hypothetical protein
MLPPKIELSPESGLSPLMTPSSFCSAIDPGRQLRNIRSDPSRLIGRPIDGQALMWINSLL